MRCWKSSDFNAGNGFKWGRISRQMGKDFSNGERFLELQISQKPRNPAASHGFCGN